MCHTVGRLSTQTYDKISSSQAASRRHAVCVHLSPQPASSSSSSSSSSTSTYLQSSFMELSEDLIRTRGNKFKLIQHHCHYDLWKFNFINRTIPIWNSLSNYVVSADNINTFKDRLDKFWFCKMYCMISSQISPWHREPQ